MAQDVTIPLAEDHPIAIALNDPVVRTRLHHAARASLGKRASRLSPRQRVGEAEAVVQEAVLRAWKRRDRIDPSKDIVKWLVGFVNNVAREFAKKRSHEPVGPRDKGPIQDLESQAVDPSRPLDEGVADKLLTEHLLTQLVERDRAIITMHYYEGMTCSEIAERLGMDLNTVRMRRYRAILKLREASNIAGERQA